jgi:hypothetical protein
VEKIFRVLGKPSPDVWPDVVVLPEWKRVQTDFPRLPPTSPEAGLRQAVPGLRPDTAAYDLLVRMVRCYPTVDPALITLPTPLLCELTCVCVCACVLSMRAAVLRSDEEDHCRGGTGASILQGEPAAAPQVRPSIPP